MTTGLYWDLDYRRGTGALSQIIVRDKSNDPWLQYPAVRKNLRGKLTES